MKHFVFGLLLILVFAPSLVFAINLNLTYPDFGGFNLADDQDLNEIVAFFYYFIIGISGLAAFVMLVWGGIQWLASGAIPSQASEAKDRIRNAILGLLLILTSFLIIQIINPELTVLGIGVPDEVGGDSPLGKADSGIFLCEDEFCDGDYIYIDPTILGCDAIDDFSSMPGAVCDPDGKSTSSRSNWNDRTDAVRFDGTKWQVVLLEKTIADGGGHALCLGSTYLKFSDLQRDHIHLGSSPLGVGWGDKVSAMRVVAAGDPATTCATNWLTLPNIGVAPPNIFPGLTPPVVFFFNNVNYGRESHGTWTMGLPLNVWAPGKTSPFPALGDQYNIGFPRSPAVLSIWITPNSLCGLTGWGSPSGGELDCAAFVASSTSDIDPSVDPYICFTTSTLPQDTQEKDPDDSSRYRYSFLCDGSEPITTKVDKVEVHASGFCPNPGVVQNCG